MSVVLAAPGDAVLVTGPSFLALVAPGAGEVPADAASAAALEAAVPGDAAFASVAWVASVAHVRARGAAVAIVLRRVDGSTVAVAPGDGVTELTEPHCVEVELMLVHAPAAELGPVRGEAGGVSRVVVDLAQGAESTETTESARIAASAEPDEVPATAPALAPDLDEETLVSQRPGRASGALLELVTGERIGVEHELLVGRSPRVRRAAAGGLPTLLAVEREDVSRTHARIAVLDGRVTLEDLGSANGTRVATANGPEHALVPGRPEQLRAGMLVSIADRLAFRVVRVP